MCACSAHGENHINSFHGLMLSRYEFNTHFSSTYFMDLYEMHSLPTLFRTPTKNIHFFVYFIGFDTAVFTRSDLQHRQYVFPFHLRTNNITSSQILKSTQDFVTRTSETRKYRSTSPRLSIFIEIRYLGIGFLVGRWSLSSYRNRGIRPSC